MQECRNAGMQECRNAGMQECRNAGMQEWCSIDNKKASIAAGFFIWQGRRDSNPQHSVLETDALPIELRP